MRDIRSWRSALTRQFHQWPPDARLDAGAMCDVELALCMAQVLAPLDGARSVPALLSGYLFALDENGGPGWSKSQKQAWGTARVLLPLFKNSVQWERALEGYRALPESLRGYTVEEDGDFVAKPVGLCARRHKAYADLLRRPVAHISRSVNWVAEGEHVFLVRGHYESVRILPELVLETAARASVPRPRQAPGAARRVGRLGGDGALDGRGRGAARRAGQRARRLAGPLQPPAPGAAHRAWGQLGRGLRQRRDAGDRRAGELRRNGQRGQIHADGRGRSVGGSARASHHARGG
jgi:hypothetical protein